MDEEVNNRALCPGFVEAGSVYAYLSANDVKKAVARGRAAPSDKLWPFQGLTADLDAD